MRGGCPNVRNPVLGDDPGTPGEHEHLLHGLGVSLHWAESRHAGLGLIGCCESGLR